MPGAFPLGSLHPGLLSRLPFIRINGKRADTDEPSQTSVPQSALQEVTSRHHRICKGIRKRFRPRSRGQMINNRNSFSRSLAILARKQISLLPTQS